MESFEGKVAFVTGGARGQGRSHALALARAGADVAVCDIAEQIDTVPYQLATPADLDETRLLIEGLGRRCVAVKADVRDSAQVDAAVAETRERLGPIDICVANAGVCGFGRFWEITDEMWDDMIATDLTSVFKTLRAVAAEMHARRDGRIVVTSSMGGRMGNPNLAHYVAAKWGVIGLVKTLALELASSGTTVNAVCPATVSTDMVHNAPMYNLFCPDLTSPTRDDVRPAYAAMTPMGVPWLDPIDISEVVVFLASTAARYISGATIDVSAGSSALMP
jgi:SDR family mycofactocin-dependent oxidoreductase